MKFQSTFFALVAASLVAAVPSPKPSRPDEGGREGGQRGSNRPDSQSRPSGGPRKPSNSSAFMNATTQTSGPTANPPSSQVSSTASSPASTSTVPPPSTNSGNRTETDVIGALYFPTNVPDSNNVVIATIGSNGNVTYAGAVFAGGSGAHGNDGGVFGADVTFSNNLLVVHQDRKLLATANTQSNTVVLFSIDPNDPTNLQMLGAPVPSQGDYPSSLTFNKAGDQLCVVNAGHVGNVVCFDVADSGLKPQTDSVRPLPNYNQTTPPTGPSNTAGAIAFTEDEKNLVVAIKGVEATTSPGYLSVWPIEEEGARIAADPTIIQTSGPGNLPFSLTPVPGRNAFVSADFSSAVDVFDMSGDISDASASNGTSSRAIDGSLSLCWSVYSSKQDRFYLSAPPSSLIVEVAVDGDLQSSVIANHQFPTGFANTDLAIATINGTDFLYALLTNGPGVAVMSLEGPGKTTVVGSANFTGLMTEAGVSYKRNYAQGLAVFMKD